MTTMPVHALLLDPSAQRPRAAGPGRLRGIAWGGERGIARVEVRVDGGAWRETELGAWRGPYARRFWAADWSAAAGEHHIEVRATDGLGQQQPDEPPPNAGGYANNALHRVKLRVET
jgi:hypothetical protein